MLRAIHAALVGVVDVTICFFGRYDPYAQTVHVVWQVHADEELPGGSFPIGNGPTSRAILTCQPQLIRKLSRDGHPVQVQYATDRPALPESLLAVPVVFDDTPIGVLCIQSYRADAYDDDDIPLVQGVADQLAVALAQRLAQDSTAAVSEVEAILASLPDALVVLDGDGRVVRLNHAARQMLCTDEGGLIFGQPVDQPQAGRWPLGARALTEQLRPLVDQLRHGAAPNDEIRLTLGSDADHAVSCRASLLLRDHYPAGAIMVLRETH